MALYLGDFESGEDINFFFSTNDGNGGAVTSSINASDIKVWKDGSSVSEVSLDADEFFVDYNAITGIHKVSLDVSDHSSFYSSGSDFAVIATTGTVDSQVISSVLAHFSIANRVNADGVDVISISGDSTAADNLESILDGSGITNDVDITMRSLSISNDAGNAVNLMSNSNKGLFIDGTIGLEITGTTGGVFIYGTGETNAYGLKIDGDGSGDGVEINAGSSGQGIDINSTAGNAIDITTTNGHGVNIDVDGSGKRGLYIDSDDDAAVYLDGFTYGIYSKALAAGMKLHTIDSFGHGIEIEAEDSSLNAVYIHTNNPNSEAVVKIASTGSSDANAIDIITTNGHGLNLDIAGSNKHGMVIDSAAGGAVSLTSASTTFHASSSTSYAITISGASNYDAILINASGTGNALNLNASGTGSDLKADEIDTTTEGTGVPSATAVLAAKIEFIFQALRNKSVQTSTLSEIYNDAGTKIADAAITKTSSSITRAEFS